MKISKMLFKFFIIFYCFNLFALELDEKLTMRILSVSASRKTVLINRGIEDGLVVGDHAKLFLTTGVVGRALVIKVSPTRSIWSVYRQVNPQFLTADRVMNLKIASPLKVTEDSSKALVIETRRYSGEEKIRVKSNPESTTGEEISLAGNSDNSDLLDLKNESKAPVIYHGGNRGKSWEAFGMLNLGAYGGTIETDSVSSDITDSRMDLTVGVEKYFWNSTGLLKDLSVFGVFSSRSYTYGSTTETKESHNEFGGGVNYYFYNRPYQYGKVLGYLSVSGGLGSATLSVQSTLETAATGTDENPDLSGKSSFLTIGLGGKFFLNNQFGALFMLDYSNLSTVYEFEDGGSQTSTLAGVRIRFGLAYRF